MSDQNFTVPAFTATKEQLNIPKYSLKRNQLYLFVFTVSVEGKANIQNSASVKVTTLPGKLKASIAYGNRLFSTTAGTLVLNGSASMDPDYLGNQSEPDPDLFMRWSCELLLNGGKCFAPAVEAAYFNNSKVIYINATELWQTENGEAFVFTLLLQKQARTAKHSVRIKVTTKKVPYFAITTNFETKLRPTQSLQLRATFPSVDSSRLASLYDLYDFKWTCTSNNVELTYTPGSVNILSTVNASSLLMKSPVGPDLVFIAGGLLPRTLYVFKLEAWPKGQSSLVGAVPGSAEVDVPVNSPPSSGTCGSEPSSGVALSTLFRFYCQGWEDEPEDIPLSYVFYRVLSDGTLSQLSLPQVYFCCCFYRSCFQFVTTKYSK